MKRIIHSKGFYKRCILDAVLIAISYTVAYLLRFEGQIPIEHWVNFKKILPFLIPVKLCSFYIFGVYRGMWRYTSLVDLKKVLKATIFSSVLIVLIILSLYRFHDYSRTVYVIDAVLTFLLIGGVRIATRLFFAHKSSSFKIYKYPRNPSAKKLMVIGAGDAGEKVLREIQESQWIKYQPVGFLDDSPQKQGKAIHGIPVLGKIDDIDEFKEEFDEILIAIPTAKGDQMRKIVSVCDRTGKRYRTLPGIWELIHGTVRVTAIRDVTLEDLLGREEIHLDEEEIRLYLNNRRILVTGAGGSIGSELVRQVCRFQPHALALLDFSEYNLFVMEMECKQRFPFVKIEAYLADIKNLDAVKKIFKEFQPNVVFHAAAYKHVPIQEINPWEAIFNNIQGTRNMVEAAAENHVDRFVLVSTDKAVRPANVMGASKRVAEMLVECMNGDFSTRFMAVRFGNVIGSSGSAIPLFQEQIARGGPLTITHPEVTRYFMSIPEASQLILQTGAMGRGREIFILDMGKPIRIIDLARDLIGLHGLEPERDIPIQIIGLRPGEKLYEELITEGEGIVATDHKKIMVLKGNECNRKALNAQIEELFSIAKSYDAESIKRKLQEIVPEYSPR